MEYLKTPYSVLEGKDFIDDLTSYEKTQLAAIAYNSLSENISTLYGGDFQKLFKIYQRGEDPAQERTSVSGIISNPENINSIHNAIVSIATKYGYTPPDQEYLVGGLDSDIYQKLSSYTNSYAVVEPNPRQDQEGVLFIVDEKSNIKYILLPRSLYVGSNENSYFVTVDKMGNVLVPKEAFDRKEEVI